MAINVFKKAKEQFSALTQLPEQRRKTEEARRQAEEVERRRLESVRQQSIATKEQLHAIDKRRPSIKPVTFPRITEAVRPFVEASKIVLLFFIFSTRASRIFFFISIF